ncbi:MAG TPA: hypothetical protein DCE41_27285 [Cytophagales bacterium]|nr:hypothetical protein [Cytophagales bacterium]HAA21952.1 hypothetical protein [Cytophagales bacterium]HAP61352.1 hypothetical protein [Cytophagales bacterium]
MYTIEELKQRLSLQPHPEGGYYAETYRSSERISQLALDTRFSGDRNCSTAIYFLVPAGTFSAFHRIQADEGWHFYYGSPLRVHMLEEGKGYSYQDIGTDFGEHQLPQFVVPHGTWFASEPLAKEGFSLVGCTVAPGFDFDDFEMGKAEDLSLLFPKHAKLVDRLTRM